MDRQQQEDAWIPSSKHLLGYEMGNIMTEEEFCDKFAANLKNWRNKRGISQSALGLKIGLKEKSAMRSIQRWELKERTPSVYNVKLLCDALQITPNDLIPTD